MALWLLPLPGELESAFLKKKKLILLIKKKIFFFKKIFFDKFFFGLKSDRVPLDRLDLTKTLTKTTFKANAKATLKLESAVDYPFSYIRHCEVRAKITRSERNYVNYP